METDAYTVGVIVSCPGRECDEYLVITGRHISELNFRYHVQAIFSGRYEDCKLEMSTDVDEFKRRWDEEIAKRDKSA